MCWMCDNPGRTTEDDLDTVRAKITANRWAVQYIEDEKSPFAYTDVHLKFAAGIFGPGIRALQLVWTDDSRQWPWDRGWTRGHRQQPVLGVRTPLAG